MTHSFENLRNKGEFRIVYLGGSITEGAGASDRARRWATQITAYLNSLGIDGTAFCEINAGIGGTNSAYGMMRLSRDVLSQKPQAVFIDFSLNDADMSEELSAQMYEGIIRRLMAEPCAPYVVCIGVVPNRETEFKTELHKKIAAHYGLQYIDVKAAMDAAYGKAAPGVNTARDALFRPDNTHPVEAGYDFYTEAIKKELSGESFRKPEGEAVSDYCKKCGKFINARDFERTGAWICQGFGDWSAPNPGRSGESLASCDSTAALTLEFEGTALLLGARFDRRAGKAELTLDGESRVCDLRYETDDQPVIIFESFTLPAGGHRLCVRPAEGEIKVDFAVIPE
ncbi:MAG: SGNH/GDSL hydrolase family protein [Clostridia bacterium]|nr:SGNH/GDSL hydrolase family protein [Clostridia bacterium]